MLFIRSAEGLNALFISEMGAYEVLLGYVATIVCHLVVELFLQDIVFVVDIFGGSSHLVSGL